MALSKDYVPKTEGELLLWGDNFVNKLPSFKTELELSDAALTRLSDEYTAMKDKLNLAENTKRTLQAQVQAKNDAIEAFVKDVRNEVAIAKRRSGYTKAIGENLGVEAAATSLDPGTIANAKPVFFPTTLPDMIRLDWLKGSYGGVIIYCKRGNETTFSEIGKDMRSPYEDTRKNLTPDVPEVRIYKMRYLLNDVEVGQWSDEIRVVVNIA
jgi:hypothetical protein